jgi:hypothetical protein
VDEFELNRLEWFSVIYAPLLIMAGGLGSGIYIALTIAAAIFAIIKLGWSRASRI